MLEELPTIRTRAPKRRYSRPVPTAYSRRVQRQRRNAARFFWAWVTSAAFGLAAGYAIVFYFFGRDPLSLGGYLPAVSVPKVSVQWE